MNFSCTPIVNKISFFPTKDINTYKNRPDFEELFIRTEDDKKLQAFYFKNNDYKNVVIFFHGNAGNLTNRFTELKRLHECKVNVLAISYRGYGKSSGKPSEKGIYKDGEAALKFAINELKFPEDRIIICGRSIGTTVAINTAMNRSVKGLILITPLTNGIDYTKVHGIGFLRFLTGNVFDNMSKLPYIKCKTLILHGTKDETVPYFMGKQIYDSLKVEKQFITIKDGFHDNLEHVNPELFWNSISKFINPELDSNPQSDHQDPLSPLKNE